MLGLHFCSSASSRKMRLLLFKYRGAYCHAIADNVGDISMEACGLKGCSLQEQAVVASSAALPSFTFFAAWLWARRISRLVSLVHARKSGASCALRQWVVWCTALERRARAGAGARFNYAGCNAVTAALQFFVFLKQLFIIFLCNFLFSTHKHTHVWTLTRTHTRCISDFADFLLSFYENARLVLFEILFHFCALQVFLLLLLYFIFVCFIFSFLFFKQLVWQVLQHQLSLSVLF